LWYWYWYFIFCYEIFALRFGFWIESSYFPWDLDSELNHRLCPEIWILNLINDESPAERKFNILMPWKFFQEGFL
jgi:hypothetical protein